MRISTPSRCYNGGLLLLTLLASFVPVICEIRTFDGEIEATSSYIHFSEGHLVAPGYVDLSDLIFTTADDGEDAYVPHERGDDDKTYDDDDDDEQSYDDDDNQITAENTDGPTAVPTLKPTSAPHVAPKPETAAKPETATKPETAPSAAPSPATDSTKMAQAPAEPAPSPEPNTPDSQPKPTANETETKAAPAPKMDQPKTAEPKPTPAATNSAPEAPLEPKPTPAVTHPEPASGPTEPTAVETKPTPAWANPQPATAPAEAVPSEPKPTPAVTRPEPVPKATEPAPTETKPTPSAANPQPATTPAEQAAVPSEPKPTPAVTRPEPVPKAAEPAQPENKPTPSVANPQPATTPAEQAAVPSEPKPTPATTNPEPAMTPAAAENKPSPTETKNEPATKPAEPTPVEKDPTTTETNPEPAPVPAEPKSVEPKPTPDLTKPEPATKPEPVTKPAEPAEEKTEPVTKPADPAPAKNNPTTAETNPEPASAPAGPTPADAKKEPAPSPVDSATTETKTEPTPANPAPTPAESKTEPQPAPVTPAPPSGGNTTGGNIRSLEAVGSTVDIVLFHEPSECSAGRDGCDWTKLGIGASDEKGNLRWCCSGDAIDVGLCDSSKNQYGRLIVNAALFKGRHRFITVPPNGKMETAVKYPKLDQLNESGKYVLVIANCNDDGRDVLVKGQYTWKSKHGYLPGDLFGEMYFFAILTVLYAVVLIWYGVSMKCYEDAIIPIQKWILVTIGMGLLETFFKTGDYWVWNEDGTRFWFAMYTGVILGVLKRAISRCLIVMVSLGWGVVRDSLGDQMRKIVLLGVLYVGVSSARDIMTIFAITENQTLSIHEEEELFDVVTILTFVVAAIDVTFIMWILDALNGTMQYLENMNQNMKLQRYLRLRCILILSILFAVVWAVFFLVNNYADTNILQEEQGWAVEAAWDLNYLFVLIGVACLWRPNPSAKDYAYVMELSSMGGDMELETNADIIYEDDDHEVGQGGGFKDIPEESDLKIDDAVGA